MEKSGKYKYSHIQVNLKMSPVEISNYITGLHDYMNDDSIKLEMTNEKLRAILEEIQYWEQIHEIINSLQAIEEKD